METGTGSGKDTLAIDATRCQICSPCHGRAVCRRKAIRVIDRDEPPFIDPTLCARCRVCIPACPNGAVVPIDQAAI